MNHLYIQTAFLGDLLLSIPAIKQIRYNDPKASLTLVCRKGFGSLLKSLALADEVIEMDKADKKKTFEALRGRTFDTVFCPHQSMTSHKLVKSVKADKKIGYKKWWNGSYFDVRVKRQLQWPEAIRQLQLLSPVSDSISLKLEAFEQSPHQIPQWARMNLPNLTWKESEMERLIKKSAPGLKFQQPYVCIAPGSVWPTKRWVKEKFVEVAVSLVRQGFQVVVMGAPDERSLCEKVKAEIPGSFSVAGHLSIVESIQMLWKSKGLICNDSGAMHMASLLDLPTLALFGPTVQELGYKPWNPHAIVVENSELLCRPCGQHGGRYCPIGTHQCMTSIDAKFVFQKALGIFI